MHRPGLLEARRRAAVRHGLAGPRTAGQIDDHDLGMVGAAVVAEGERAGAAVQRCIHDPAVRAVGHERAELGRLDGQLVHGAAGRDDGLVIVDVAVAVGVAEHDPAIVPADGLAVGAVGARANRHARIGRNGRAPRLVNRGHEIIEGARLSRVGNEDIHRRHGHGQQQARQANCDHELDERESTLLSHYIIPVLHCGRFEILGCHELPTARTKS